MGALCMRVAPRRGPDLFVVHKPGASERIRLPSAASER